MPEARIVWPGKAMNQRTVAMVLATEKIYRSKFRIIQGSYNKGGVTASAGTHDGGGAVDIDVIKKSPAQRRAVVLAFRQVGFATWVRTPAQGRWPYHVHAIAIGDKDLSRGARNQVAEYKRKRNGLANRGKDDGPPGYYGMTWELYLKAHPAPVPHAVAHAAPDATISLGAMALAGSADATAGAWSADRARVVAWAAHPAIGAIGQGETMPPAEMPWHEHFRQVIQKVQQRFELPVTGTFDDQTAEQLKRYGYEITS